MSITIKDVAKKAGVSCATVSLALRPDTPIAEKTRQKVLRIVNETGYRPSYKAQALKGSLTNTICFLFNKPFFDVVGGSYMDIFNALNIESAAHNHRIFLNSTGAVLPLKEAIPQTYGIGVDGLIVVSELTADDREFLKNTDIPVILMNRDFQAASVSCIVFDDCDGATKAVEYLLSLGHERIAFLGKNDRDSSRRRLQGYMAGLENAGISLDSDLIFGCDYETDSGKKAGEYILNLKNKPTAILCATDILAVVLLEFFRQKNVNVPGDVSVVGIDNSYVSNVGFPKLTTIDLSHNIMEMAKETLELMIKMAKYKEAGQKRIIPVELLVRESTAPYKKSMCK